MEFIKNIKDVYVMRLHKSRNTDMSLKEVFKKKREENLQVNPNRTQVI